MNSELLTSIFVSVIGSGILATILTAIVTRKKLSGEVKNLNVDASQKQVQTSLELVESYKKAYDEVCTKLSKLQEDMDELSEKFNTKIEELSNENIILRNDLKNISEENVTLKLENEDMSNRITILEAQVVSLGGTPTIKSRRK